MIHFFNFVNLEKWDGIIYHDESTFRRESYICHEEKQLLEESFKLFDQITSLHEPRITINEDAMNEGTNLPIIVRKGIRLHTTSHNTTFHNLTLNLVNIKSFLFSRLFGNICYYSLSAFLNLANVEECGKCIILEVQNLRT